MRTRIRLWAVVAMAGTLLLSCSRDPNVRKQKYFRTGMQYYQAGKYQEAALEFANAIQLDSRFAAAHYQLAQCYVRQSIWNGAYVEFLRTVDIEPQNADALTDLAKLLLAARKFQDARDRAAAAITLKSDDFDAQIVLANSDAALGNAQLAGDEVRQAIQIGPSRPEGYVDLGLMQLKDQKPADGEANLLKAISVNPNFLPARLFLAEFYQGQKRWPEAEQQYNAAIAAAPGSPGTRAQLARMYLEEGRKADAERTLADAKSAMSGDPQGYRMLGDYYIGVGDTDRALAEFASLAEVHPKDMGVKRSYTQLLLLKDRTQEAETLNDEILKANPKDAEAMMLRGEILGREGRSTDAISALQDAVKSQPSNAAAHYYLGVAYSQTGSLDQAQAEWQTAAHLAPSGIDPQRALASLALQRRDWKMLAASADQLILMHPAAGIGYLYRGTERAAQGDQAAADMDFKKTMELAPGDASGYVGAGKLRLVQKSPEEAQKLFEQALLRDPNSQEALGGLVLAELQQKQQAKALSAVQAQIAKAPNNSGFYMLLGNLLLATQDQAGAMAAIRKAADLNPNNADASIQLGRLLIQQGSADQAIAGYRQAIIKNPKDIRLYMAQASAEEGRGNWQEAEKLYQQALGAKPDDPVAANNLAFLLIDHGGDKNLAVSLAQTARRGMPKLANTADTLGWAYYYTGQYPSAIATLQEAIKSDPSNAAFHYHLGLAYQKMNDGAHAKEQLERALQLHPAPAQLDDIRKALGANAGA